MKDVRKDINRIYAILAILALVILLVSLETLHRLRNDRHVRRVEKENIEKHFPEGDFNNGDVRLINRVLRVYDKSRDTWVRLPEGVAQIDYKLSEHKRKVIMNHYEYNTFTYIVQTESMYFRDPQWELWTKELYNEVTDSHGS